MMSLLKTRKQVCVKNFSRDNMIPSDLEVGYASEFRQMLS